MKRILFSFLVAYSIITSSVVFAEDEVQGKDSAETQAIQNEKPSDKANEMHHGKKMMPPKDQAPGKNNEHGMMATPPGSKEHDREKHAEKKEGMAPPHRGGQAHSGDKEMRNESSGQHAGSHMKDGNKKPAN